MTGEYIEAWAKFEQETQDFDDHIRKQKVKIAQTCVEEFLLHYNPGKTKSVVGWLESGMNEVMTCTGHALYLAMEDAKAFATSLRDDAIEGMHVDVASIPDAPGCLPAHIIRWLAGVDLVVAVDDRFLMKGGNNGADRIFYERGCNREMDRQLKEQLSLLKEALEVRDQEDAGPAGAIKWMNTCIEGVQRRRDKFHEQKVRCDLAKPDCTVIPPKRFRLPNGKWLDYPQ
jgi:hypothetical protein